MAVIVKIPQKNVDYDFIAFSFNGYHSYEDFGIYRTSNSSRYTESLAPTLTDKTAEVPGGDGTYYFSTKHKQKAFSINFAFDHMEEKQFIKLKQWLNGKNVAPLWFAEAPHKVYSVKVTGTPNINYVCFEEFDTTNKKIVKIYKGEGTIQFTAYYPYARTPDYIELSDGTRLAGNHYGSYRNFFNYELIKETLPNYPAMDDNNQFGDLPFTFVAYLDDVDSERNSKIKITANGIEYSADDEENITKEE